MSSKTLWQIIQSNKAKSHFLKKNLSYMGLSNTWMGHSLGVCDRAFACDGLSLSYMHSILEILGSS